MCPYTCYIRALYVPTQLLLGIVDEAADAGEAELRSRWYQLQFSHISARGVPHADEGSSTLSDPYASTYISSTGRLPHSLPTILIHLRTASAAVL